MERREAVPLAWRHTAGQGRGRAWAPEPTLKNESGSGLQGSSYEEPLAQLVEGRGSLPGGRRSCCQLLGPRFSRWLAIQQLFACCCKPQRAGPRGMIPRDGTLPTLGRRGAKGREGCRWSLTRGGEGVAGLCGDRAGWRLRCFSMGRKPMSPSPPGVWEAASGQPRHVALPPSVSEETEAQRGCRARGREEQKARRRPEVLGAAECVPADQRCL